MIVNVVTREVAARMLNHSNQFILLIDDLESIIVLELGRIRCIAGADPRAIPIISNAIDTINIVTVIIAP